MAKNKMPDKKKNIILIVAFISLIVLATICILLLTPFAKRLLGFGKNNEPIGQTTTEIVSGEIIPSSDKTTFSILPDGEVPSVSVPKPTAPDIDTEKNYTFFIDKSVFDHTIADGETILKAKNNSNVIITVTPYKTTSYSSLCNQTAKVHPKDDGQPKLNTENLYSVYHSDLNGTTTTVYCIDDGNGGSIKLKYERPSSATEYDKHFEILVSMFKVK